MTYCLAIKVQTGLVLAADSRTSAGVDNISTYPKMHLFARPGQAVIVLLSSGNLATTQSVVRQLNREAKNGEGDDSIFGMDSLETVADHVGQISRAIQQSTGRSGMEASFIVGGQVAGETPEILMVYPEGNHIRPSPESPFFQIGEIKYGKPILDRIINEQTSLEDCARCALVSLDSTMKSNLTVGPPVDLLVYRRDALAVNPAEQLHLKADDAFFLELCAEWSAGLRRTFNTLPRMAWERAGPAS